MSHTPSSQANRKVPFLPLVTAFLLLALAEIASVSAGAPSPVQAAQEIAPDVTPQIEEVKPNQVAAGSETIVVIKGQNFSSGAYVSFSDPQVHVVSSRRVSPTQLEADVAVSKKARAGAMTLYASNPASTVAEAMFSILEAVPAPAPPAEPPTPSTPPAPPSPPSPADAPRGEKPPTTQTTQGTTTATTATQTFSVYDLGEAASILQSAGKSKATLAIAGGKVNCEGDGKGVFSAALANVQEVEENAIFGVKSGTFHIILRSGKTYNFIASSLKPADTEAIVAALKASVK